MSDQPREEYLTTKQVAKLLGCSVDSVLLFVRTKGLERIDLGPRLKVFRRSAVEAWLNDRAVVTRPPADPKDDHKAATRPSPNGGRHPGWDGIDRLGPRRPWS